MIVKDALQFLREVKLELSKVVWPKFDEWIGATVVTLVLVVFFAIYLGALDFGFSRLAKYVFNLYSSY